MKKTSSSMEHSKRPLSLFDLREHNTTVDGIHVLLEVKKSAFWDPTLDAVDAGHALSKKHKFKDAHIVLFNLDQHAGPFVVPPKAHQKQVYAVTGFEPTYLRMSLWGDAQFTSLFDMSVHWGAGADVPLGFFDGTFGKAAATGSDDDDATWWESSADVLAREFDEAHPVSSVINHDCARSTDRVALAKAVGVAVNASHYGQCLSNVHEKHVQTVDGLHEGRLVSLLRRHRLHLAFERTDEAGWLSRRVFDAFRAGTVPVFRGHGKSALAALPNNSFVLVPRSQRHAAGGAAGVTALVLRALHDVGALAALHAWRDNVHASRRLFEAEAARGSNVFHRMCKHYFANVDGELSRRSTMAFDRRRGWQTATADTDQYEVKQRARVDFNDQLRAERRERRSRGADGQRGAQEDFGYIEVIVFIAVVGVYLFTERRRAA